VHSWPLGMRPGAARQGEGLQACLRAAGRRCLVGGGSRSRPELTTLPASTVVEKGGPRRAHGWCGAGARHGGCRAV